MPNREKLISLFQQGDQSEVARVPTKRDRVEELFSPAEALRSPTMLLHTGRELPVGLEIPSENQTTEPLGALRKIETIQAPGFRPEDPWAALGKAETIRAQAESDTSDLTQAEAEEYRVRQRFPDWLNEQIEYTYRHPGRTGLEVGAGIAIPELAAAKWGATVPGRMAVRSISGMLAGTAASLASETFDPTQKPLSHALTVGAYNALGEAFGELTATGANALLARGRRFEPGAREAFEQLRGRGVPSPGQLSQSPWIDLMENVTHSSLFGHAPIQGMRDAAEAASQLDLEKFVKDYIGKQGFEEIGGTLQNAIELSNAIYKDAGNKFYDALFGLAEAAKVQGETTGKLLPGSGIRKKALVSAINRVEREGKRSGTGPKSVKWVLDEFGDGNTISLQKAHALRSDLRTMIPSPDEPMPSKAPTYPLMLANALTKEMKRYAKELGPDVARQLELSDTYWSALHEVFGDKFIKELLKAEPETVLKKVTPPEMPGTVRRIREIVLDPRLKGVDRIDSNRLWEQVQGYVMMRIARRAEDADLQVIGRRGMRGLRRYWDETLDELFPDKTSLNRFKGLLTTLKIGQGEIGKGLPGGIATRLLQAGIIFDLPRHPGRAAQFFVPVWLVKRVFTNEKFAYWAAIGSKAEPGSFAATRAFTAMQAIVNGETRMQERQDAMIESVKATRRAEGALQ